MRGVPPPVDLVNRMFSLPQNNHPERMWVLAHLTDGIIFDLGCGSNRTVAYAIGVDVLPVTDITCSIDEMPMIGDGFADVLISRHSLEHLSDPKKALNEWKRILMPGGVIVIVLPDDEFIDTMHPVLSAGKHLQAFTRDSFRKVVEEVGGLEVLTLETVVPDWSFGGVLRKEL